MADTKISALPAVTVPAGTDEFPVNQGAASKKETLSQIKQFVTQVVGNAATADVVANAADTYLTGTSLLLAGRIKAGTIIRYRFSMTKTAAGTAAPTWNVRFGTAGTVADASRILHTGTAQTAAIDTGYVEITLIIRDPGATGTVRSVITMEHHNTTTGLQNVAQIRVFNNLSAAFDLTVANLQVGVSCNPGASGVWTFQLVAAEMTNLL